MLDDDLERMRRNPGSVSRRDLVALREAGFELVRTSGKHEAWRHGIVRLAVPGTLKGSGAVRALVEAVIETRRQGRGQP